MEGLKLIPYIAIVLAISGVILGASVITLSKFQDTQTRCYNTTYTYNTTDLKCYHTNLTSGCTTGGEENFTREYFSINKGIEGIGDVAEQTPTVAIIAVMVIIISIIAGVFVYMRYFA